MLPHTTLASRIAIGEAPNVHEQYCAKHRSVFGHVWIISQRRGGPIGPPRSRTHAGGAHGE
jgi:hypothetical protein